MKQKMPVPVFSTVLRIDEANTDRIDTDILSEFLRGNSLATKNAEKYLAIYGRLNFSIITYNEILNGLLYKDAKKTIE